MASNSSQSLIHPDGYALSSGNNSITSMWADKRSSTTCSISFVLLGSNSPTGTLTVETSDAPENYNALYGSGPLHVLGSDPVDVVSSNSTAITAAGVTRFEIVTSARWVRVKYVSTGDVSGLTVYAFINTPFQSA